MLQEPRRVPPSADGGRGSNRVFRRRVRRKTHFPGRKCANREPKQSPAKRVCLGEKGQGSGVNPGRQAGANGADFDPTKCAQRPASPRKNACIIEKRVEVFRHAERPGGCRGTDSRSIVRAFLRRRLGRWDTICGSQPSENIFLQKDTCFPFTKKSPGSFQ